MQTNSKNEIKEHVREFLDNTDGEFKELQGGTFVYLETGEFFTKIEHDKLIQKKLEAYKVDLFDTINTVTSNERNIENQQMLINRNSKKPVNKKLKLRDRYDGGNFNIVYTSKLEEVYNMKLNNNEKLVFYILRDYIQYPTNCLVINDKIPTIKELEPIIGLTERTIITVLKVLETKNLIKRVQSGHKKAIYFNPEYYASGKDLEIKTLQLFDLIECDDAKVNSYLVDDINKIIKND